MGHGRSDTGLRSGTDLQTPASIVQIRFQTVGPVRSDTQTDFMEAAHLGFAELADLGTSNEVDKAMCTCRS